MPNRIVVRAAWDVKGTEASLAAQSASELEKATSNISPYRIGIALRLRAISAGRDFPLRDGLTLLL